MRSISGLLTSFVVTLILGYILYVGAIWIIGKEYEFELNKYDLDGDGMFSTEEYTPDAQAAMKRLTNDTGRTFAPIVAAPVTFIWTSVCFLIMSGSSWIYNRYIRSRPQNK